MAMRGTGLGAVLAVAGMLAGCAPPQAPKLDVETQWSDAVGNLGLFPIYPPSEDVMVGDAFLYLPKATFFNMVRVTAAPLPPLAEQFCYQEMDRMALDTQQGAVPGVVRRAMDKNCHMKRDLQQIAPYDAKVTAADAKAADVHVTRLREAAIPRLEVARFTEGEVAGAGLLGNFGAALGIGGSGAAALSVTLGKLQGATLDELRGSRLVAEITVSRVRKVRAEGRDYPNALTPLMLLRSLRLADHRNETQLVESFCRGRFAELDESGVRVVVANRVLYAGHVTFEFLNQQTTAVRMALDFAGAIAGLPQPTGTPALPGAPPAAAAPAKPTEGGTRLDAARAEILGTASRIITMTADGPAKVSARLTTGTTGKLAMDQEFLRPAAVGMGAALHYPLWEAAVPASASQVQEAVRFCGESLGLEETDLGVVSNRLWRNYAWAFYLHRRETEAQPARLPARAGSDPVLAWKEAQDEIKNYLAPDAAQVVVGEARNVARGGRLKALPANAQVRVRP